MNNVNLENDILNNDIPKHRKKKNSSKSKSKEKANHKHEYVDCLLIEKGSTKPYVASYCKICGKIGDVKWATVTSEDYSGYSRMMTDEEVYEKYKDLERIKVVSIMSKYLPISIRERL